MEFHHCQTTIMITLKINTQFQVPSLCAAVNGRTLMMVCSKLMSSWPVSSVSSKWLLPVLLACEINACLMDLVQTLV